MATKQLTLREKKLLKKSRAKWRELLKGFELEEGEIPYYYTSPTKSSREMERLRRFSEEGYAPGPD